MDRRQLAMLTSWAGDEGIRGRKRLQKIVYFLQAAGCRLNCDYTLHHFGPYSRDVADACDEMVASRLLEERVEPNVVGTQYSYRLSPEAKRLLAALSPDFDLQAFEDLAKRLFATDLWQLELGSTIAFFQQQLGSWDEAMLKACEFKKVSPEAPSSRSALTLARGIVKAGT